MKSRGHPALDGSRGAPSPNTARLALDLVIKTRFRDIITYQELQRDIMEHCRLKGRVYVIVPQKQIRYFRKVVTKSFVLISSEEVLEASGRRTDIEDTWSSQQILKLLASSIIRNEEYLILDSNTLLGFDFNENFFRKKGLYVYGIGDFSDIAWELQSRNLLRVAASPAALSGFRSVNQIFLKANVRALLEYLERLYGDDAVTTLLRYSDHRKSQSWTEYTLYGVFCQCILTAPPQSFQVRRDLLSFGFKISFQRFLVEVERHAPLMIKFYKRRPAYLISDVAYRRYVAQIRSIYDGAK